MGGGGREGGRGVKRDRDRDGDSDRDYKEQIRRRKKKCYQGNNPVSLQFSSV